MTKKNKTALHNSGSRPARGKSKQAARSSSFYLRLAAFGAVALVVVLAAVFLVRPFTGSAEAAATVVTIDMSGFAPSKLTAKAGQPVRVRVVNPDSEFHTDGGGKHEFKIDELGVDAIVAPKSQQFVTFTPTTPGTYQFYCDVCCGGKDNPSMVGTLTVTA